MLELVKYVGFVLAFAAVLTAFYSFVVGARGIVRLGSIFLDVVSLITLVLFALAGTIVIGEMLAKVSEIPQLDSFPIVILVLIGARIAVGERQRIDAMRESIKSDYC